MTRYYIYKLINLRTGKTYTGLTTMVKIRIQLHFGKLRCNKHENKELQKDYNNGDKFAHREVKSFKARSRSNALRVEAKNIDHVSYNVLRYKEPVYPAGPLKAAILKKIDYNTYLQYRIGREINRCFVTVKYYAKANSPKLASPAALAVIRAELKKTDAEILDPAYKAPKKAPTHIELMAKAIAPKGKYKEVLKYILNPKPKAA